LEENIDKMIVVITHAVFLNDKDIHGPPHTVALFLKSRRKSFIFLKHRLFGGGKSTIECYRDGKMIKSNEIGLSISLPLMLSYIVNLITTIWVILSVKETIEVVIAANPLNAFISNILRLLNKSKIKNTVYLSADFAIQRFDNLLLNKIYHVLDTFSMELSNYTWSVSKRIVEYRSKKGLDKNRNLFLPNSPLFSEIKLHDRARRRKFDLVIVSAIEKGIAFKLLIRALSELKHVFRKMRLIIIGSGSEEQELRKYVKKLNLEKDVIFIGLLSHGEMFKILTRCGVGIALYDTVDKKHFRFYSDPMKARDYLAAGLPVIISGNTAIGYEINNRKAGYLVRLDKKDIVNKIKLVFSDPKTYQMMRRNALLFSKDYNIEKMLTKYLSFIEHSNYA
jgi:glycosyltransferase involved in cell wall biosynthesis